MINRSKASKICCPHLNCPEVITEGEAALVDMFDKHLIEKHGLSLDIDFKSDLQSKIMFIRNNNKIPYIDPFIVVTIDKCTAI